MSVVLLVLFAGCSRRDAPAADAGPVRDATFDAALDGVLDAPADAGGGAPDATDSLDAPPDTGADADVDLCTPGCGPDERCGPEGDGDGSDDDCDGEVDETCTCVPGTARACFAGPPSRRGVGACADGVMICGEFTRWGPCRDLRAPLPETCDGADDDCNGSIDDGLVGCASAFTCPATDTASPLRPYELRGDRVYAGAAASWTWTVTCPPTVSTCPAPLDPAARETSVYFVASGNYRVRVDVVAGDGTMQSCTWVVYVRGDGLRVELEWDTQGLGRGDTDVDLHVHRRSIAPGSSDRETDWFTADDCFYLDCKASTYGYDENALALRWRLPSNPDLAVCREAPGGEGGVWEMHGACFNPRLDVDVISCDPAVTDPRSSGFCAPENVNIDEPPVGEPYRIAVNYYSSHGFTGDTHPHVVIYCHGELRGAFGLDPLVTLRSGDPETSARLHDTWLVADVVFFVDACGRPECRVVPLGDIVRDASFGPAWTLP